MKVNDLCKEFPYLTRSQIQFLVNNSKYKTERGLRNHISKENEDIRYKCEASFVYRLEIEVTWRKSNTWGLCPRAEARWKDEKGWQYEKNAGYASGCGYDKHSACVAEVCNKVLSRNIYLKRSKISEKNIRDGKVPYGIRKSKEYILPTFEGGVGMNCYFAIARFLGGELYHVADSKTYDKWVFEFKKPKKIA